MKRILVALCSVVALGAVLGTGAWWLVHDGARSKESLDHTFVVPLGTGNKLDGGESVEILPRDLEVRVGDRLVVVNDDDRAHDVGPWTVGGRQTFTFTFREIGRYDSRCTLHTGGGRFFIDVLAPEKV